MHVLRAAKVGYAEATQVLDITQDSSRQVIVRLESSSASFGPGEAARRSIELVPALLLGASIGSEAEESCKNSYCSGKTAAFGGVAALRIGWEFIEGARFELGAGLIYLTKKQQREVADDALAGFEPLTYNLSDKLRVRGPFVSSGMAFQHRVNGDVEVGARVHLGLSQIFARHRTEGTVDGESGSDRVRVSHSDAVQRNVMLFGWPEAFVGYSHSVWRFGAGLGAFVILNRAQQGKHGGIWPQERESAPCEAIGCAPPSRAIEGERPFGPSAFFAASLYAGLGF
jgi:hypothetical protein